MFSTRYAPAVLALLALASVPTVIHSYLDTTVSDGREARALPARLAGETGATTARRASWGEVRFGSIDWIERRYAGPPAVTLFVGRSFDAKRLYHHPELAVDYGHSYLGETVIQLPERPGVPIHLLRGLDADSRRVGLYALQYGDGYVADPIRFQLRTSLQLLFSRRQAMTLFFAVQDMEPDRPVEKSRAAALLLAALEAFGSQAPGASP